MNAFGWAIVLVIVIIMTVAGLFIRPFGGDNQ